MEKALEQQTADCLRIVLFGPESTGKTTLAKQLAAHYSSSWVPEFMREYLQKKWDHHRQKVTKEDLLPIAVGQMRRENELAQKASQYLFCDTNLLELKVYSQYYYDGFCPPELTRAASNNVYDLYLLTGIDTPWIYDDLRDRPEDRLTLFRIFEAELKKSKLPYAVLNGSETERLKLAIEQIENLGRR
jgi:NadR type nicotinamide-nucleotide adenylyltransferase